MTMIYAIFGIPLMLLCLANIGSTMADAFRFIYCNICCSYCNMVKKRRNIRALQSVELSPNTLSSLPPSPTTTTALTSNSLQTPSTNVEQLPSTNVLEFVDNIDYRKVTIPISVTLSLLSSYLILGAILFSEWENWKLLDGAYFCFVTLATIGLGKQGYIIKKIKQSFFFS
jgi:potassium channel subfamily K protein